MHRNSIFQNNCILHILLPQLYAIQCDHIHLHYGIQCIGFLGRQEYQWETAGWPKVVDIVRLERELDLEVLECW